MKVIIATEFLHEKDWGITHLEELISLFPEASLVSLTYEPMSMGSKIESLTIVSSQVNPKKLFSKPWHIGPLVSNIPIPRDTDLVISLSRGYIHELTLPDNCSHLIYHIQPKLRVKGWKRFLDSLLSQNKNNNKSKTREIFISEYLASISQSKSDKKDQPSILKPFFKPGIHEFDQVSEKDKEIDCVIHITSQTSRNLLELGQQLIDEEVKFLFHGSEELLNARITDEFIRTEHCYEKGCHGSEQKLFENTKMFVDLTDDVFNPLVLQALSAGVGVYTPTQVYKGLFSAEFSMNFLSKPNIKEALECSWWESFNPQKARREALRLNGRIFKRNVTKYIKEISE